MMICITCKLIAITYLIKLLSSPDPRLKSMQPYFEIDWLMPRVHLALCSFSEIMYFVRNSPDMVFFACWEIGAKELKYKDMKKMVTKINLRMII